MNYLTKMKLSKNSVAMSMYTLALVAFLSACRGGSVKENTNDTKDSNTTATTNTDSANVSSNEEKNPEAKIKQDFKENTLKKYPEIVAKLSKKWKEISFEHKDGKIENVEKENDYLVFKNDGTFEEYFHTDKKIEAGNWKLVKEGKVIHLTSTEHRVMQDVEREIVELDADKFVWLDNTKKKSTFKSVAETDTVEKKAVEQSKEKKINE